MPMFERHDLRYTKTISAKRSNMKVTATGWVFIPQVVRSLPFHLVGMVSFKHPTDGTRLIFDYVMVNFVACNLLKWCYLKGFPVSFCCPASEVKFYSHDFFVENGLPLETQLNHLPGPLFFH